MINAEMYGLSNDNIYFDPDIIGQYDDNNINALTNIMNQFKLQKTTSSDNLTTGRSVVNDMMTFRTLKSNHLQRHIKKCAILSYDFFMPNDIAPIYIASAWDKVKKIKITIPDLYRILKRLLFFIEIRYESKKIFSKNEFIEAAQHYYNTVITVDNGYFSTLILPNNPLFEYFKRSDDEYNKSQIESNTYEAQSLKDQVQTIVVHNIRDNYPKTTGYGNKDDLDVDKWSMKINKNDNNLGLMEKQSKLKKIFSTIKPKGSARSNADSVNDNH